MNKSAFLEQIEEIQKDRTFSAHHGRNLIADLGQIKKSVISVNKKID